MVAGNRARASRRALEHPRTRLDPPPPPLFRSQDDPTRFNWCSVPDSSYDAFLFATLAIIVACCLHFSALSAVLVLVAGAAGARQGGWGGGGGGMSPPHAQPRPHPSPQPTAPRPLPPHTPPSPPAAEALVYSFNLGRLGNAFTLWLGVQPPELLLYAFLPPLLMDSALSLDWFVFRKVSACVCVPARVCAGGGGGRWGGGASRAVRGAGALATDLPRRPSILPRRPPHFTRPLTDGQAHCHLCFHGGAADHGSGGALSVVWSGHGTHRLAGGSAGRLARSLARRDAPGMHSRCCSCRPCPLPTPPTTHCSARSGPTPRCWWRWWLPLTLWL